MSTTRSAAGARAETPVCEPFEAPEQKAAREAAELKRSLNRTGVLLAVGGALCLLVGSVAPASFMQHFIVFVLSVFVGFQVIWNVAHSLHTPLMAVTKGLGKR